MQPEAWVDSPDYAEDLYDQTALNESEHVTGDKNRVFAGLRMMSPGMYQWAIVVLAVGFLWAMHYGLRSTFKAIV